MSEQFGLRWLCSSYAGEVKLNVGAPCRAAHPAPRGNQVCTGNALVAPAPTPGFATLRHFSIH